MKKILLLLFWLNLPIGAGIAIVSQQNIPLNKESLGNLWSRETQFWNDGSPILLLDNKGPVAQRFYEYMGKSAIQYKRLWMKQQLAGEGKGATSTKNDAQTLELILQDPATISFVDAALAKTITGIHILLIIP